MSVQAADSPAAPPLSLRPLELADEDQARQAHAELATEHFEFLLGLHEGEPWPSYLSRVDGLRRGVEVPSGWVPSTLLAAVAEGHLVGRVSVRHRLNPELFQGGGHIGYAVRAPFRRRGYGTALLQQALAVAAHAGVKQALITCDDDNVGSAKVIERCGGVRETHGSESRPPGTRRRYWVNTDQTNVPVGDLAVDDPRAHDIGELLSHHLTFARTHSPPEDVHALDIDGLLDPAVTLFSFRRAGKLLGLAALKELDPRHGEVKSMHTAEAARSLGIGRALLDRLVEVARGRGYARLSLETGSMPAFAPARGLYSAAGFTVCEPFGDYRPSPNSTCMTLLL